MMLFFVLNVGIKNSHPRSRAIYGQSRIAASVVALIIMVSGMTLLMFKAQSDEREAEIAKAKATPRPTTSPTESPTPTVKPSTTATPSPTPQSTVSLENASRYLVGEDQDLNRPADADDIHVKRVSYLLHELTRLTQEDMNFIASATDTTSKYLLTDYGRKVPREKLLEDMKAFYSDKSLKVKLKYQEAITVQAMIEYAK